MNTNLTQKNKQTTAVFHVIGFLRVLRSIPEYIWTYKEQKDPLGIVVMSTSLRWNENILRTILPVLMPSVKHVRCKIKHDEIRELKNGPLDQSTDRKSPSAPQSPLHDIFFFSFY